MRHRSWAQEKYLRERTRRRGADQAMAMVHRDKAIQQNKRSRLEKLLIERLEARRAQV